MSAKARVRLEGLSKQLKEGIPDEGTFENIPRIRRVAGDSAGPRVKDKVVIITGLSLIHIPSAHHSLPIAPLYPITL
jgi:hypothetical protein